ncbi:MAG: carbon-nitrogen hydrolase family protein [Alphaproteobacteria bacterium]
MTQNFTVACVQTEVSDDTAANIERARGLAEGAVKEGAGLVCFAEYFTGLATRDGALDPVPFAEADHPALPVFQAFARDKGVHLLLGSLGITLQDGTVVNRSYVIDGTGGISARYDKIHLFDVNLGPGMTYRESAVLSAGDHAVVAPTPWGGLGLSICYDLRFAHLYRALAQGGASFLAVPAAFTKKTGEVHWKILNQARAIEHGCFVFAPCSYGSVVGGGECYGHSLIIDPWGKVLAEGAGDRDMAVLAEIDTGLVDTVRSKVPALRHDRPYSVAPAAQSAAE